MFWIKDNLQTYKLDCMNCCCPNHERDDSLRLWRQERTEYLAQYQRMTNETQVEKVDLILALYVNYDDDLCGQGASLYDKRKIVTEFNKLDFG